MGSTAAETTSLTPAPGWTATPPLSQARTMGRFEHAAPFTIGVEEELMLVHPASLDLAPAAGEVLAGLGDDGRFSTELQPSQLETITSVCATPAAAGREMAHARRRLVAALGGRLRVLASGTHPFSTAWGEVTENERYRLIADEYTWAARRSLACGLHVHVALPGPEHALAVHDALRSHLPELAALGANSAFFQGADTGMCSVRPKLIEAFPRSGIPPAFRTWDELMRFTDWGRRGGLFPDPTHFWWDLRLHVGHGTLEVRVADTQTRLEDACALVALVQATVCWLAERFDAGETLPVHESHWIAENAWRAHRHGVRGWFVDLDTGRPEPARDRIARLLTALEPYAEHLSSLDELHAVRPLLAGNGSDRQRYVFRRQGMRGLMRWLVEASEEPVAI